MAIFDVTRYPAPVLLAACAEIKQITDKERLIVRDMIDTMYAQKGVGLAANQIGLPLRLFVASPDGERGKEYVFFNPRIIKKSGSVKEHEGCLSMPGLWDSVKRYAKVTLEGMNLEGQIIQVEATGLLARIFQHETDHLNGYLFVHRLGFFKKHRVVPVIRKKFGSLDPRLA